MMKQLKTNLLLLLLGSAANAQLLTPQVINAAGVSSSNGIVLLEYNVGGISVATFSTPTSMYTQDFLQPDAGTSTGPIYINDVVLSGGSTTDNAGTTFVNGAAMIEFTVGEVASITLTNGNMLTQGILQPTAYVVLPVTGLDFYANRINANKVKLHWTTNQEINNHGFYLERKKENENNFEDAGFVTSNAAGGNSSLPLSYSKIDDNSFAGKTWYRLRQQDMDGSFVYSLIRMVNGSDSKQTMMQVWPIPSNGPVNVLVNGIAKTATLQVFDMNGKLVHQLNVVENTSYKINSLLPGTYVIRLAGQKDIVQKIVIQ